MKLQILALFIFVALPIASIHAQTTPTPTPVPNQAPDWTSHCRDSTISFGVIQTQGDRRIFRVIGTGVIIAVSDSRGYIVTAKHVFDNPQQGWHPSELRVRYAWQDKYSVSDIFGDQLLLRDSKGTNLWGSLTDDSDLAAIQVPDSMFRRHLEALSLSEFATANDLFDGATIFVYGFPEMVGNERLVRAVTRSGIVAWTDPVGPLDHSFLVDANIMPGNSGGPVFKVPIGMSRSGSLQFSGKVAFLGIVSSDVSKYYQVTADGRIVQHKWDDMPLPSNEIVQVTGIGGLGNVEPARKVLQLINSLNK
jgi:hypothetical protein